MADEPVTSYLAMTSRSRPDARGGRCPARHRPARAPWGERRGVPGPAEHAAGGGAGRRPAGVPRREEPARARARQPPRPSEAPRAGGRQVVGHVGDPVPASPRPGHGRRAGIGARAVAGDPAGLGVARPAAVDYAGRRLAPSGRAAAGGASAGGTVRIDPREEGRSLVAGHDMRQPRPAPRRPAGRARAWARRRHVGHGPPGHAHAPGVVAASPAGPCPGRSEGRPSGPSSPRSRQ